MTGQYLNEIDWQRIDLEYDHLMDRAKIIEKMAERLSISKSERNAMYEEASQIRGAAEQLIRQSQGVHFRGLGTICFTGGPKETSNTPIEDWVTPNTSK